MTIGVVIADDQALVRGGFRVLVDIAADMEVLGEASDGTEAVALARQHHPDVVLMDVRMPVQDGIEATRLIKGDNDTAGVKVLVLTTFDLDEYVYAALLAGASGFLLKDTSPEKLLDGIRVVASGESLLAPTVTRRLIEAFTARVGPAFVAPAVLETLTDRELEEALALTTGEADKALGLPRRELCAGAVADLVVVRAASVADAIVDRPPRTLVLRAGRIAAEHGVASAALKEVAIA